jgi:protein involved in polysaccharide export with SLBB domain
VIHLAEIGRCVLRNASRQRLFSCYGFRVLIIIASTAVGACNGVTPPASTEEAPTGSISPSEYKLANGEKVRIVVSGEDKLSGEFTVDPAGNIAFPLVGKVRATGLSARELEESLGSKLKGRYLVNPRVFVEVLSHRPFYVMGEVRNVGEFAYRPGLNVVTAILLAGGYGSRASTSFVYIKRASGGEEREYPAQAGVLIFPGDIIRIPERYF